MVKKKFRAILFLCAGITAFAVGAIYFFGVECCVDNAKEASTLADIENLNVAISEYKKKYNKYPSDLNELSKKKIIKVVPVDPWGKEYVYELEGEKYSLISSGYEGYKQNNITN